MFRYWAVLTAFILSHRLGAVAQYPPPVQYDRTYQISSPSDSNVTISYKTPAQGTCTTVFDTQRQYTGYVTLPPSISRPDQGNYTINTFFWFFEARQLPETSPLTIFINGGPGSSSMIGLFQEVGPCEVIELGRDRLGTVAREWGWDRSSNLIFIDQPTQTGFSFDQPANASLNLLDQTLRYPPTALPDTQPDYTFLNGTFASDNPAFTANTSSLVAHSIWHFIQGFLQTFPEYSRSINGTSSLSEVGVNLFTESYGGRYGPSIGSFFEQQNQKRSSDPTFANSTIRVSLKTLGIINGWVDAIVQAPFFPTFAYKNSYSVQAINQVQQLNALSSFRGAGGCQELTTACRAQETAYDSDNSGDTPFVNEACAKATYNCQSNLYAPYLGSRRSIYDITQSTLDPFPKSLYLDYLNNHEVQQAIGVPVNYTAVSLAVYSAFNATGDWSRRSGIQEIADLLNAGVRVAFLYGDRDYVCNWLGGEAISFAVAGAMGPSYNRWYGAGYAPIVANDSYIGGVVREFGNLSFSRIYDAGHLVPAYQPETAFTVFSRIIKGNDISLGNQVNLQSYQSIGEANSTHQNVAPPPAEPVCYIRAVNTTCNVDHRNMLANDAGVIINGVLYGQESDWTAPDPSVSTQAGVPGSPPSVMGPTPSSDTGGGSAASSTNAGGSSSSRLPTGVFTATGTPAVTSSTSDGAATPTAQARLMDGGSAAAAAVMFGYVAAFV